MAVLVPAIPQEISSRIRYPKVEIAEIMGSMGEIVEESPSPVRVVDDKVHVAVSKDVKKSEATLKWALHNSGGRKICILHVHQPAQKMPISHLGVELPISQLEEREVRAYHEIQRQNMFKLLDKYSLICERAGVRAEKLHIEADSIEKGITELISQHHILKLVMGAAADRLYSRKMMVPKSKKAIYVRLQAPDFCHIWFICKGHLIYTREGRLSEADANAVYPPTLASPNIETGQPSSLKSQSTKEGFKILSKHTGSALEFRRVMSDRPGMNLAAISPPDGSGAVASCSRFNPEGSFSELEELSRRSPSEGSRLSTCSSEVVDDSPSVSFARTESENESELRTLHYSEYQHRSSPPSVPAGSMNDEIYDRLEQFVMEAENSRREAYEESIRRRRAEKDAIEAIRRAKASETLHAEEMRQRREIEEALAKGREDVEKMKRHLDEVTDELRGALEHKASLESQLANSDRMIEEMEQKIFSAVDLLQNYKKERDELEIERDNTLKEAEDLRKKQAEEASSRHIPQFFSEFSFAEIEGATRQFDPTMKIGEGGYGSIYMGLLRNTQVAVKMLNSHSLQGPSEFQQEVDILSKFRHPNLITLIGACPEVFILVYEYLPNGSLEDRLSCKDNTPPLSWQTRIRIAAELCSVLIFLHTSSPHSIVHGDLKPANILLDANFVSKLSDFGICRIICKDESSSNSDTRFWRTEPKGTFAYVDPEFLATGELTQKSDVYSFGIILLRLLTGRPALRIANEVQYALDKGNLKDLLDPTAGDWPFVQAKQLAHLALRCCDMNRRSRPDLTSEVWRVLEPMRVSCGASSFKLGSEEHCQIPHYFVCPILQEIMQDPVVAADGFTYEAEALRGWLDSGHDTSPMTNLKLAHSNLVPNRALRSAIQEWLQQ